MALCAAEILVLDSSDCDAAKLSGQSSPGGFRRRKRQAQIVGQTICRAQRNNRQCGFGADDSLQHIVNRAVAAAGEHGIAAFSDCSFGLLGRIGGGTCGCSRGFDSGILQNGEC